MEYDELLTEYVGEFGRYQKIIYFLLCLVGIPASFNIMSTVFIVGVPDHWCDTPDLDHLDLTLEQRLNLSIPWEEGEDGEEGDYISCSMFNRNYSGWTSATVDSILNSSDPDVPNALIDCQDGWIYDDSLYTSTVVSEWDMVCDNRWLQATSSSVYMAGMMVGVVLSGTISDLVGRKITLCGAILLMVGVNVSIAFINSYVAFLALRFFLSMCSISMFTCAFVMGIELVGPKWRIHCGTIIEYFWAAGYIILAGIAYFIRDWRKLQLAIAIPPVILLIYFWALPESPRWLYIANKPERGDAVVRKMARINKKELPEKFEINVTVTKKAFIWDILRTPRMRLRSLNVFFNWFVNSFVYYGLSLNSSNLGGDPYINYFISGAVEIPAYIFAQVAPNFIGRRWPLIGTLLLAGVALLVTIAVPSDLNVVVIVLAMIGKFAISASFAIIYLFTAELYPTKVRNVSVGAGSLFARVGGIIAPYVAQLSDFGKFIPFIIFGVCSVAAGILTFFLPETKDKNLPETMEDGENFGRKTYKNHNEDPMEKESKKGEEKGFDNLAVITDF